MKLSPAFLARLAEPVPPGLTMVDVLGLDPLGTVYTFVDHGGGTTHIAAGILRDMLRARAPRPVECEFGQGLLDALARGDLGVEEDHALALPDEALKVPIIVGEWGREHIIIDGAHRLWRRWKRCDATFPAYYVPEKVWRHFTINDMPGDAAFWDDFNRNAKVRGIDVAALLKDMFG